jgi:hypothetical protein
VGLNRIGALSLIMALVWLVVLLLRGSEETLVIPMFFAAMGGVGLGYNALRLPGWALEREKQMEQVAARARVLIGAAPEPQEAAAGDLRPGSSPSPAVNPTSAA